VTRELAPLSSEMRRAAYEKAKVIALGKTYIGKANYHRGAITARVMAEAVALVSGTGACRKTRVQKNHVERIMTEDGPALSVTLGNRKAIILEAEITCSDEDAENNHDAQMEEL